MRPGTGPTVGCAGQPRQEARGGSGRAWGLRQEERGELPRCLSFRIWKVGQRAGAARIGLTKQPGWMARGAVSHTNWVISKFMKSDEF